MSVSRIQEIVLGAWVVGLCACAAQPVSPSVDPSPPSFIERVEARVQAASEREVHELRYNPGLCGCPPFELELEGLWHRVTFDVVDDSNPVLQELRAAVERDEGAGSLGRYLIQGRLDERLATCGQGAVFLTLDPTAYGAPEIEEESPAPESDESDESEDEGEAPESASFNGEACSAVRVASISSSETSRSGAIRPSSR